MLHGPDLQHRVDYLGARSDHRGFGPISRCADFRAAVNEGVYDHVVVGPNDPTRAVGREQNDRPLVVESWLGGDPNANVVFDRNGVAVVDVLGPLDPNACD